MRFFVLCSVIALTACEDMQPRVDNHNLGHQLKDTDKRYDASSDTKSTGLASGELRAPKLELGKDGNALKEQIKADAGYVADETSANAEIVGGNVERAGSRIADNVRDQVKKTNRKVRDWWLTPLKEPQPKVVSNSYCYRVMQDILCYREPMPGWEQRLVAYQGTHAEPPPVAMTKPLPTVKVDPAKTTAYRVNNAKPVFVSLPTEDQKKQETVDGVSVLDESRETLPNPASVRVPQL